MADILTSQIEAIPLPLMYIGRASHIIAANTLARDLLGHEIVGRHFVTALRQPGVLDAIEACMQSRDPHKATYLASDGETDSSYTVTVSHVFTQTEDGVMVCFEDITQIEQTRQMRSDFVANVSHELRSPLTSVLGFIETLQGPARRDDVATDRFLQLMQQEAMRMERLVKDLLSLSRVESLQRVRPSEVVELQNILNTVFESVRALCKEHDVKLELVAPDMPVRLQGDGDQLIQVFLNLIENAVKYGGPGKTVKVKAEVLDLSTTIRGPAVSISVRDEGPGISAVHIPRLTERFYRVDDHRSRDLGGTGLGLAIVKHILNRHRGRLKIISEDKKGATFQVLLPYS